MPDKLTQEALDRSGLSTVINNHIKDPHYCPYCMRCPSLHRMKKIAPFHWTHHCGAVCDLREYDPHAGQKKAVEVARAHIDWVDALRKLEQHPQVQAEKDRFSGFHNIKPEDMEMRFK